MKKYGLGEKVTTFLSISNGLFWSFRLCFRFYSFYIGIVNYKLTLVRDTIAW